MRTMRTSLPFVPFKVRRDRILFTLVILFFSHACWRFRLTDGEGVTLCEDEGVSGLLPLLEVFMPVLRPLFDGFHAGPILESTSPVLALLGSCAGRLPLHGLCIRISLTRV